jgi:hypothetical protein
MEYNLLREGIPNVLKSFGSHHKQKSEQYFQAAWISFEFEFAILFHSSRPSELTQGNVLF